jgi:hypothetical protein
MINDPVERRPTASYRLANSQPVASLDVRANQKARKYNSGELARRILWSIGRLLLFRLSPRPFLPGVTGSF